MGFVETDKSLSGESPGLLVGSLGRVGVLVGGGVGAVVIVGEDGAVDELMSGAAVDVKPEEAEVSPGPSAVTPEGADVDPLPEKPEVELAAFQT